MRYKKLEKFDLYLDREQKRIFLKFKQDGKSFNVILQSSMWQEKEKEEKLE